MADKPEFDPSHPYTPAEGDKPPFDPSKTFTTEFPPSDPSPAEEFLHGFTSSGRGIAQIIGKAVPGGAAEAKTEGEVKKGTKIGTSEPSDLSPAGVLGNIADPMNYVGAGALGKFTKLGPMAKSIVTGGLAGAMQPVEGDEDYGSGKARQIEEGMALGYGFSVAGKAASKGLESFGDYLARNHPDVIGDRAVQTVLRRIQQDAKSGGPSAKDALDLVTAANAAGKPMTLADVGGKNVRRLAGNVYRQGGESANIAEGFLTKRDEGAAQRLSQDISRYVSGGPTMHQATESLLQARSAAARPLYSETDKLQGIWSPRLAQFLDDPDIKAAMARGYKIERLTSLAENRAFNPTMMGVDVDAEGNIKLLKTPNMRVLDMAKQGLDAQIADQRDPITGRLSSMGVALDKARRAYVSELDALDKSGVYKKAREAWGGYSASLDALRQGRSVFANSPEENAAAVAKLSLGDREFHNMGVADTIKEKLAKTGLNSDEAKSIIKNQWMRDQLRPSFRTQADFDAFVDSVAAESKMFKTKFDTMGGSQSAERLAEDGTAGKDLVAGAGIAGKVMRGSYLSAVADFWRLHRDLGLRPDPKMAEAIAKILFSPNAPETAVAKKLLATEGDRDESLMRSLSRPPMEQNTLAPAARAVHDAAPYAAAASGQFAQ
jgi:hypothetical protein